MIRTDFRPKGINPVWSCDECSLRKRNNKPVWGRGPKHPLFMLVGEGPGSEENRTGVPFHPDAPAGGLITDILTELNVKRDEIYFTNATRCMKSWNEKITPEQVKACKPYLLEEIKHVRPKYIVLAGNAAMKAMLGRGTKGRITKEHGLLRIGSDGLNYFPIIHPAAALPSRQPEFRKMIKDALAGLISKIRNKDRSPLDNLKCNIVDDIGKFRLFKTKFKDLPENTVVVNDYESNSVKTPFHIGNKFVLGGSSFCCDNDEAWYVPLDHRNPSNIWRGHYAEVKEFFIWYAKTKFEKIAQNAKYEYNVTRGYFGVRLRHLRGCTMLLSHTIDPTQGMHGLDKLAWQVGMGGYELELEKWFLANWPDDKPRDYNYVPLDVLGRYSCGDAIATRRYYLEKLPVIKKRNQTKLYFDVEMPGLVAIANMEASGQLVDVKYNRNLEKYYKGRLKMLERNMGKIARVGADFNFSSSDQIADLVTRWLRIDIKKFDKEHNGDRDFSEYRDMIADGPVLTDGGRLSVTKKTVKGFTKNWKLKADQKTFFTDYLEYKAITKRLTTNVIGIRRHLCADNRVRSSYLQHGAETARRSSSNPPRQQDPRQPVVRRQFIAKPDYLLISPDFKNVEVRIAADRSEDKTLVKAFADGKDVHTLTAAMARDLPYDRLMKYIKMPQHEVLSDKLKRWKEYNKHRADAKVAWWVLLFGGGAPKMAAVLGIGIDEAEDFMDSMLDAFPGLKHMFKDFENFAIKNGYTLNGFGRRRYIKGLHSSSDNVRSEAVRKAMNTPIQSTAADMTLLSMAKIDQHIRSNKLPAALTQEVHDSITTEVHRSIAIKLALEVKEICKDQLKFH